MLPRQQFSDFGFWQFFGNTKKYFCIVDFESKKFFSLKNLSQSVGQLMSALVEVTSTTRRGLINVQAATIDHPCDASVLKNGTMVISTTSSATYGFIASLV